MFLGLECRLYGFVSFDAKTSIAEMSAKGLFWLAAKIVWVIVWWADFIHKAFVYFGIALAPILNAKRGIALRYVLVRTLLDHSLASRLGPGRRHTRTP